jgi:hypothetical protein
LPSRPDDPDQGFAWRSFFSGHQRHLMIDPDRIQCALSKNSRPSSPRSGVVPKHSKPFAVSQAPRILLYASPSKPPRGAHHARFCHYLRPVLLTSTHIHQSKPIAHPSCSGSVQYIFSSPARLRSRFLSASAYRRHAADLKMLCIIGNWQSKAVAGVRLPYQYANKPRKH